MKGKNGVAAKTYLFFSAGFVAVAAQVYLVRETLVLFAGNELSLGVVYTGWFLGIVLGAWAAGYVLKRRTPGRLSVCLAATALCMLPVLAVATVRCWRLVVDVPAGQLPGLGALAAATAACVVPVGTAVGVFYPLLCAYLAAEGDRRAIGRGYLWESVGATVGGVVVCTVLVGVVPTLPGLWLVGAALLSSWVLLGRVRVLLAGLILATVALAVFLSTFCLDRLLVKARFDSLGTGLEWVDHRETPYHHLDIARLGEQFSIYADGKVIGTWPDPYRAHARAHLVMCQHPRPKRVLVIGEAPFEAIVPLLMHRPESVEIVVVDDELVELAASHMPPAVVESLKNRRVRLVTTDGRRYLAEAEGKWDVIFCDLADPTSASQNRYYTQEFFELAALRLARGGVFVTRLSSSVNYLGRNTARWVGTTINSLKNVFEKVVVLPGEENILIASNDLRAPTAEPELLRERYEQRGIADSFFTPYQFFTMIQQDLVSDLSAQLARRSTDAVNTDSKPVTFLMGLLRWSQMQGEKAGGVFLRVVESVAGWWWFVLAPLLVVLVWAVAVARMRPVRKGASNVAVVFAVGAAGMAAEMLLLYTYQAKLGSIYLEVGLVVSAFMGGLSAGSWIANRVAGSPRLSHGVVLSGAATAMAGWCLVLAMLSGLLDGTGIFFARVVLLGAVVVTGTLAGFVFPVAGALEVGRGRKIGEAAGLLDSADHLGALSGAVLGGIVLLPAVGLSGGFGVLCVVLFAAAAIAVLQR